LLLPVMMAAIQPIQEALQLEEALQPEEAEDLLEEALLPRHQEPRLKPLNSQEEPPLKRNNRLSSREQLPHQLRSLGQQQHLFLILVP
jgi:hypothetical protein